MGKFLIVVCERKSVCERERGYKRDESAEEGGLIKGGERLRVESG